MLSKVLHLSSAFALIAAMINANLVSQDDPSVNAQEDRSPAAAAPQAYRVKQVLGSKVSIEGGVSIGTVDDIVFADDGYVEYLVVNNQNKLVTVPWEAAKFNFEKRSAMINITPEQFRQVPTYTVEQYPTFSAPAYRTETYKFYGLTPRQERRIERKLDRRL
jgi:hypothetical protein